MNTAFDNERASSFLQWMYKNVHFLQLQDQGVVYNIECCPDWTYEDWVRLIVPKHLREYGYDRWIWHFLYERIRRIDHNIACSDTNNYWPQQTPNKYASLDLAQYIEQRMQEAEVKEQQ